MKKRKEAKRAEADKATERSVRMHHVAAACTVAAVAIAAIGFVNIGAVSFHGDLPKPPERPVLDKDAYNAGLLKLAHINQMYTTTDVSTTTPPGFTLINAPTATTTVSVPGKLYPVQTVYPLGGALLPEHRIVAFYGNFYSRAMGVLGEYPPEEVLARLASTTAEWQAADPQTPVMPAIHYIAVVAQGAAGEDGKYRARMPDEEIDKALAMARSVHGVLFIDIQVGLSDLQHELPAFTKYLKEPDVHLAIDPEFATAPYGYPPGKVIGTMSADDINFAARFLADLVDAEFIPPKILVVHRFTKDMVTDYKNITPLPEVQVVMDMDGWGTPERKRGTYNYVVAPEPVQFTGFKIFFKNDLKPPSTGLLTPKEVLDLTPSPSYIQYQ